MSVIYPIVMASGGDKEGWIFSRGLYPKVHDGEAKDTPLSFFQATCRRLDVRGGFAAASVVCNGRDKSLVEQQMAEIGVSGRAVGVIQRDDARETALRSMILEIAAENADAICAVLPATHVIGDVETFLASVRSAARYATGGHIVLFVVGPRGGVDAENYVRKGKKIAAGEPDIYAIAPAEMGKEQPALSFAFGKAGFYWNSGITVSHACTLLDTIAGDARQLFGAQTSKATDGGRQSASVAKLAGSSRAALLMLEADWRDAARLPELIDLAAFGVDTVTGEAVDRDVLAVDLAGLIDAPEVVVVAGAGRADDVANFVRQVRAGQAVEVQASSRVKRPWGSFTWLASGERYRVKLMEVSPGNKLGARLHHHRSEHWVVLGGTARVMREQTAILAHENDTIFIAPSSWHGLENPGRIPLVVLEVQAGSYLGDDDIVCSEITGRTPDN
ncbi:MAG: cupin domain-containing protein [Hyphomicrobium sp.]